MDLPDQVAGPRCGRGGQIRPQRVRGQWRPHYRCAQCARRGGGLWCVSATLRIYASFTYKVLVGACYIYRLEAGAWTQYSKLIAPDGGNDDRFGVAVGMYNDGTGALIGAHLDNDEGSDTGKMHSFTCLSRSYIISSTQAPSTFTPTPLENGHFTASLLLRMHRILTILGPGWPYSTIRLLSARNKITTGLGRMQVRCNSGLSST